MELKLHTKNELMQMPVQSKKKIGSGKIGSGIVLVASLIISLILQFISMNTFVTAHPTLPTEFYGTVTTYNSPAAVGYIIAYANTTPCGNFSIVNSGFYGVLSCVGRDTDDLSGDGAFEGQEITFRYNGDPVTALGDATFSEGVFKFVNITHPSLFCGDGFCDILESCVSCELDCNSCNYTGNATQNETNATGNQTVPPGPSTGDGGGGGGGGGSSSFNEVPYGEYFCNEVWVCGNWSECSILGIMNRSCRDLNSCGTYNTKPREIEECVYLGTCFDNLINCHDGSCEEGIDCGGPCDKKCPVIEQPLMNITTIIPKFEIPTQVCERHITFDNPALWIYLAIIILAIISRHIYSRYYIKKLRKNEHLTPLERSKKIRSSERKTTLFTIMMVVLTVISLIYSYYFILCPSDFFKYSWMFVLALMIVPFAIHSVMKKYEYNESRHIYISKKVDDTHYQSLIRMIELENNMLADEENALANRLYELSKKEEFKDIIERDPNLKELYNNLLKLYAQYTEKKNPFNIEKAVCDEISALDNDEYFKESLSKHPELKNIHERLKKLYAQYEEKQKLYDKLDEIEQDNQKGENK